MAILVLLIRLAPLIVDFLGPSAAETVPDSGFSIENLQAVGFSVLGVYLVVSSGTGLLGDLALAPPDQWGMVPATFWFKPAIMLAAGLYLTAARRICGRLVGAMRRAGQG